MYRCWHVLSLLWNTEYLAVWCYSILACYLWNNTSMMSNDWTRANQNPGWGVFVTLAIIYSQGSWSVDGLLGQRIVHVAQRRSTTLSHGRVYWAWWKGVWACFSFSLNIPCSIYLHLTDAVVPCLFFVAWHCRYVIDKISTSFRPVKLQGRTSNCSSHTWSWSVSTIRQP